MTRNKIDFAWNKKLKFKLKKKSTDLKGKVDRYLLKYSKFEFQIVHFFRNFILLIIE